MTELKGEESKSDFGEEIISLNIVVLMHLELQGFGGLVDFRNKSKKVALRPPLAQFSLSQIYKFMNVYFAST